MKFKVHMLAFAEPNTVRMVDLPYDDLQIEDKTQPDLLEEIYHWGQNDIQPLECPSVSVGDVIELQDGTLHVVAANGFTEFTKAQFDEYSALPKRERLLHILIGKDSK